MTTPAVGNSSPPQLSLHEDPPELKNPNRISFHKRLIGFGLVIVGLGMVPLLPQLTLLATGLILGGTALAWLIILIISKRSKADACKETLAAVFLPLVFCWTPAAVIIGMAIAGVGAALIAAADTDKKEALRQQVTVYESLSPPS